MEDIVDLNDLQPNIDLQDTDSSISIEFINNKQISFTGGIILLFNNVTGPGLSTIPIIFQQAGWFT